MIPLMGKVVGGNFYIHHPDNREARLCTIETISITYCNQAVSFEIIVEK